MPWKATHLSGEHDWSSLGSLLVVTISTFELSDTCRRGQCTTPPRSLHNESSSS
jgi:hypothetical protein